MKSSYFIQSERFEMIVVAFPHRLVSPHSITIVHIGCIFIVMLMIMRSSLQLAWAYVYSAFVHVRVIS